MEEDLARQLAAAHREGRHDVDPAPYARLDREAAYRVQARVQELLEEAVGALKVGIAPNGGSIVAPIYRSKVGESGRLELPSVNFVGLEVEIAVVLGRDLDAAAAAKGEEAMLAAIDHFVMGIEVVGTRYADRTAVGPEGGLADSVSALGYAVGRERWTRGSDIDGLVVTLEFNGASIYSAPVRHSFGTVLKSFFAYARSPRPLMPLRAGLLVTTGSLCGLVLATGPGHAVAWMGGHMVEVDIV